MLDKDAFLTIRKHGGSHEPESKLEASESESVSGSSFLICPIKTSKYVLYLRYYVKINRKKEKQ